MCATDCTASIWYFCNVLKMTCCGLLLYYICRQYTKYKSVVKIPVFLPQFSCLHHLEGNIFHWLETRAQISKDVKGCFLSREFDYSIFYRSSMVWLDFHYLFPFQLYMWWKLFILMWVYYSSKHMAWGCDMINRITSLQYRLNVCSVSISSKYAFQTGWIICVMACTAVMNLKTVCFPALRTRWQHILGQNTSRSFCFS